MNTPAQQLTQIIDDFLQWLLTAEINWETRPAPGKWSRKEILGHLTDSADVNLNRLVRGTYEQNFKLIYDQDKYVTAQHYQDIEIDDLLTLWRLLNKQLSRVLENYPAEQLQNTCDTGKYEINLCTMEYLATDYISHLQHHLKQIHPIKI